MADTSKSKITSLSVNQTQEFFAIATEHGFEVHKIDPLNDKQTKTNISEEVKLVQMMYKTSLVGIVLKSEPTKLLLWDDTLQKSLSELTFATPILSVRMRKDMIAVALQSSSLVFNINNFNCIETIETSENLTGILSIATAQNATRIALACPHKVEGIARVHFYIAHQNALSALSVNPDGTLLASASNKGTIIRIFSTESGNMLQELRRGSKTALINQIIFNNNSKLLACCSDRPTIHVFELSKIEPQSEEGSTVPTPYESSMNEQSASQIEFLRTLRSHKDLKEK